MNNSQKAVILPTLLILAPVVFWLFILVKYAANVPWFDDFDPFPDFLRQWILTESFSEKIGLIFQPNNEHRMIWGKLSALGYYKLTGTLNFRVIQLSASLLTLGVLVLFWKAFKAARVPLIYFLPVPLFVLHLQFYGTYLWAICSMQHQPVVFFTALTAWLLAKGRFKAGVVAALCANFAMGNGILVWTAGFAILLFLGRTRQLAVWVGIAALSIFAYFLNMSPQGNESSFTFFIEHPHLSFIGFFTFLGGLFDLFPDRDIVFRSVPTFVGGFFVGLYAIWWVLHTAIGKPTRSKLTKETQTANAFLVGILVFILANAAVIALLRPRFGMDVMLVSNYKIYPGLFFAAAYLSLLFLSSKRKLILKAGIVLAGSLWTGSLMNYLPTIRERSYYFEINAYNQRHNQFGLGFEPGSKAAEYIDALVKFIDDRKIYTLPQTIAPLVDRINGTPPSATRLEHTVTDLGTSLHIVMPELETATFHAPIRFFCLSSATNNYLFKVEPNINRGRNPFKKYEKGTNLTIDKRILTSGSYELFYYDGASNRHFLLDPVTIE
jgi:hypothetical protein